MNEVSAKMYMTQRGTRRKVAVSQKTDCTGRPLAKLSASIWEKERIFMCRAMCSSARGCTVSAE